MVTLTRPIHCDTSAFWFMPLGGCVTSESSWAAAGAAVRRPAAMERHAASFLMHMRSRCARNGPGPGVCERARMRRFPRAARHALFVYERSVFADGRQAG